VKKLPASDGKLAVAGFCWGGGQSFRFATNRKDLSAAYVFYGPPPKEFATITAPVYGFYAGNDARITSTVPETEQAMKKAGKTYEPKVYEGAGHGFMRAGEDPGNTNPANKAARDEAWKRWTELLGKL
jgi:carboxymethylenebutenolidase